MLEVLDAAATRRWCGLALDVLAAHRAEIDALNVFPVPDGDTGSNLLATWRAVAAAVAEPPTRAAPGRRDRDVPAAQLPPERPDPSQLPEPGVGEVLDRAAHAALLAARGNSGVIVSQLLRGFAEALTGVVVARGHQLQDALSRAAESAYAALAEPVEGTALTVARAAADAARAADPRQLSAVVAAAATGAGRALARTPEQLAPLAEAGVVDAGGRGLVLLLDTLAAVVTGAALPSTPSAAPPGARAAGVPDSSGAVAASAGAREEVDHSEAPNEERSAGSQFAYEVQYLLSADEQAIAVLRRRLAQLGDSLAVVAGAGARTTGPSGAPGDGTADALEPAPPEVTGLPLYHVHVHVDDVGAAIEAGVDAGRPRQIRVTRFADQPGSLLQPRPPVPSRRSAALGEPGSAGHLLAGARPAVRGTGRPRHAPSNLVPSARRAVVLLPPAAGLERLFADAGAVVLAPETGTPSTQEVITAIDGTGASEVVVLPNDPNALGVVQQAAALARADHPDRLVAVIPTRSAVQALAAIAVSDPARSYGDDVIAMTSAAGATRYAGVTRAVRAALTGAGPCDPGDVLGVLEGDIVIVAPVRAAGEPAARPGRPAPPPDPLGYVARRLVERMLLGGGELVTLVAGRDAPAGFAEQLAEQLRIAHPGVDVVSVVGGQPRYPLLVGVE